MKAQSPQIVMEYSIIMYQMKAQSLQIVME